jgi:hypothetical protein
VVGAVLMALFVAACFLFIPKPRGITIAGPLAAPMIDLGEPGTIPFLAVLTVDEPGTPGPPAWEINSRGRCPIVARVRYGEVPAGFVPTAAPRPLRPNRVYQISALACEAHGIAAWFEITGGRIVSHRGRYEPR